MKSSFMKNQLGGTFSVAALRLWSALPESTKNTNNIHQFKKKKKTLTHSFEEAFIVRKL